MTIEFRSADEWSIYTKGAIEPAGHDEMLYIICHTNKLEDANGLFQKYPVKDQTYNNHDIKWHIENAYIPGYFIMAEVKDQPNIKAIHANVPLFKDAHAAEKASSDQSPLLHRPESFGKEKRLEDMMKQMYSRILVKIGDDYKDCRLKTARISILTLKSNNDEEFNKISATALGKAIKETTGKYKKFPKLEVSLPYKLNGETYNTFCMLIRTPDESRLHIGFKDGKPIKKTPAKRRCCSVI